MNELALFAGSGGGILGGHLLGWRTRCAVEFDAYARAVLLARQRDGFLPRFPIWDDVRTFDGNPWRGSIDIVTGGFPCQDISAAGKGAGITGERSGLWKHMARIVGQVRPCYAWVENSPMLVGRGLAVVLGDLAEMGYDARWGIVGADDAGAPHGRKRIWVLAYTDSVRELQSERRFINERRWVGDGCDEMAHSTCIGRSERWTESERGIGRPEIEQRSSRMADANGEHQQGEQSCEPNPEGRAEQGERPAGPRRDGVQWWATEPNVGGMAHGMAADVDIHGAYASGNVGRVGQRIPQRANRLRCIGNGQVPASLVMAWNILSRI